MTDEVRKMLILNVNLTAVWLIAMVIFLIVEAAVPGLVSIWFALGAFAALLSSIFHAPLWLQLVWFFAVSFAALLLTRPLAKKFINARAQPTNADMLIGQKCVVTEEINNLRGTGAVSVGGKVWTARTEDNDRTVPEGQQLSVLRIEGVKLIVE